jgi:hypothetical protein
VHRNIGHPLTQEPGWDVMFVKARDEAAIDRFIAGAEKNHWVMFCCGGEDGCTTYRAVFYKPHGRQYEWVDPAP